MNNEIKQSKKTGIDWTRLNQDNELRPFLARKCRKHKPLNTLRKYDKQFIKLIMICCRTTVLICYEITKTCTVILYIYENQKQLLQKCGQEDSKNVRNSVRLWQNICFHHLKQ